MSEKNDKFTDSARAALMQAGPTLTKNRAIEICKKHEMDPDEMMLQLGDYESYPAHELYTWLGY